jgi:hypothetical protein
MAISRAQLLKELVPGLNKLFGLEYKKYTEEHTELYEMDSSERAFEEEQKLGGFKAAGVKLEGSPVDYDNAQEAWTARYTHVTIAQGFALTEEAFEDNLYGSLSSRYTKALARSMAHTKQVRAAATFNDGFTTFQTGDGVTLFSTAHPLISGGTLSNRVAADLSETALENASIAIAAWTDERGLLIAARPRKLAVPPALLFTAERILTSKLRVATSDNDPNAMRQLGTIPEGYCVNHYFTDTNAWFLLTDVPGGFKMFNRVAIKTGSEVDFDTGNMKYKSRERYSFGATDPLGGYGSSGGS